MGAIEHEILRREDPRIHFAIVCASIGCPKLRSNGFQAETVDADLDEAAREFVRDAGKVSLDEDSGRLRVSKIFEWFKEDFVKQYKPASGFGSHKDPVRASLHFLSKYVSAEDAAYLREGAYKIEYLEYDWKLNEQKPPRTD